jgi:multidrug efflux pump subunit AcrA (membrane-fusion protein)
VLHHVADYLDPVQGPYHRQARSRIGALAASGIDQLVVAAPREQRVEEGIFSPASEIGAAVDQTRGTVTVRVMPLQLPDWLRPGQTVNVNIITHRAAPRLLIPASAVGRSSDQTVGYIVENGRTLEKVVLTRPPTAQGVPVPAGLSAEDWIIADARGLTGGERVRVRQ